MKNTADGYISESVTLTYKIDKTNPTGEIRIDQRNAWQSFWNTISFDLFYKSGQTRDADGGGRGQRCDGYRVPAQRGGLYRGAAGRHDPPALHCACGHHPQ